MTVPSRLTASRFATRPLALLLAGLLVACEDDRPSLASLDGPRLDDGGPFVQPSTSCGLPAPGCGCEEEGTTAPCGQIKERVGSYYTCSLGSMTCMDGHWTRCIGARLQRTSGSSSQRLLAYGASQLCGADDICNPYCNQFEDAADDLTVDPADDITVVDAGITLKQAQVGSTGGGCTGLAITPGTGALTITQFSPLLPKTLQFAAAVTPAGCYTGALQVLWAIDRFDIATISASGLVTLVAPFAGQIQVTARAGLLVAPATLDVTVSAVVTTSAPAGTSGLFTSAAGSYTDAGLTALYPYANTVFPLGLGAPLIQWRDTAALTAGAVKISLRYPSTGTPTFQWSQIIPQNSSLWLNPPTNTVPLAAGPRAVIPDSVWNAFERAAQGGTGAYVIQRVTTHGSAPTQRLRQELVTPIKLATGQLKGTVYYQSYGTNLALNWGNTYTPQTYGANVRFGAATVALKVGATYPTLAGGFTSTDAAGGCRVCHSASADGSVLVTNQLVPVNRESLRIRLGIDSPSGGAKFLAPYAPSPNLGRYSWPAIYPDGSLLFNNAGPPHPQSGPGTPNLDGSAGDVPNRLYSLATSTLGQDVTPAAVATYLSTLRAATPVFSPVGNRLAFNHYAGNVVGSATPAGDKRSLAMIDYNSSTKAFSNFRRLVTEPNTQCSTLWGSPTISTDPCSIVWPTFMPGNAGVVYEREVFNNGRLTGTVKADFAGTRTGCDSATLSCGNEGTRAELWWVSLDATPTARRLNAANGLNASNVLTLPLGDAAGLNGVASHTATNEGVLNYEATVNPQAVGGYYWVAFTSRRLYGNVATVNPWWSDPRYKALGGSLGPTTKKIWVSAIAQNPAENTDPSAPAFYLPGQEYLAGNSKAYWVLEPCRTASATRTTSTECQGNLDCCGAPTTSVCSLATPIADPPVRHCVPQDASVCIADDSTTECFNDAQCCGFTDSRCANGRCRLPPPLSLYQPGTFVRDFVSDCAADKRPVWQLFEWQADLPAGTSISFTAATAESAAALATAATVSAGTAEPPSTDGWTNDGTNINDELKANGSVSRGSLRIVANLSPSSDGLSAPVLKTWRVIYECLDAQ